jgi:outer membrane protein insertion porin family
MNVTSHCFPVYRFYPSPSCAASLRRLPTLVAGAVSVLVYGSSGVSAREMSTNEANSVPVIKSASVAGKQEKPGVPPPIVRSVSIVNSRAVPTAELAAAARRAAEGKPGDSDTIRAAVDAVLGVYRKRGFTVAQVIEAEVSEDGTLTLKIAEGTIRRILVRGNTRTKTRTIMAALTTRVGDTYRADRVAEERERLSRLGIFGQVQIGAEVPGAASETESDGKAATSAPRPADPPDPPDPKAPLVVAPITPIEDPVGQVDLVVRVQEQPTVNIAATIGYSDGTGAVGFVDVAENNLFGTAQRVSLTWQRTAQTAFNSDGSLVTSDSRSAFSVAYLLPSLRPGRLGVGLDIYDSNTVFLPFFAGGQETIRSYERRKGARMHVGTAVNSKFTAAVTARRDEVGYDPIPNRLNPPVDELARADGTIGALGVELILDGRDAADNPRRGFRHTLAVERAASFFGGNRTFTQGTLDLRYYTPIGRRRVAADRDRNEGSPAGGDRREMPTVFAIRALGGTTDGDVPLSEQFFLGGFDLLRGYDLFSVRGDRMLLATAEVRVPLGNGLQGVAFTELGNAWAPETKVSFSDLRSSVGIGLRFLSPIGPIRLDVAYGSRFQTYISLGQSF